MPVGADGAEYIYGFIILDPNLSPVEGTEYIYTYIDSAVIPHPTVLGAKPGKVNTGDLATVIATGAGSTQATYSGRIQGQDDTGAWSDLAYTRWAEVAATSDAYTVDRLITDDMEIVDVEHVEIDIVVPPWATPPNFPVRVVTDIP